MTSDGIEWTNSSRFRKIESHTNAGKWILKSPASIVCSVSITFGNDCIQTCPRSCSARTTIFRNDASNSQNPTAASASNISGRVIYSAKNALTRPSVSIVHLSLDTGARRVDFLFHLRKGKMQRANSRKKKGDSPSAVWRPINSEYSPSPALLNALTLALYKELKCNPSTVQIVSRPQYTSWLNPQKRLIHCSQAPTIHLSSSL